MQAWNRYSNFGKIQSSVDRLCNFVSELALVEEWNICCLWNSLIWLFQPILFFNMLKFWPLCLKGRRKNLLRNPGKIFRVVRKATVIRATKTSNLSRNIAAKLVEKRCCAFYIPHTTCLATKKMCCKLLQRVAESRTDLYFLQHAAATCNTFFLLRDKLCVWDVKRAASLFN